MTELVRLIVFLVATTYLPGRALSRLGGSVHPALQTAYGLSVSLLVCVLPPLASVWSLAVVALGSGVALFVPRSRINLTPSGYIWAHLLPGMILGCVVLSLGPWRDVTVTRHGEDGFVYRTGRAVGNRSAGPRAVLAEGALVRSRTERAGDPFVSGLALQRVDPRRSYWSHAERFSGVSPYVLIGHVEPTLVLLGVLMAMLVVSPRASWRGGILLFGGGFGFAFALMPAVRSWPFRIWAYLSESTGLADLLTDPTLPLLLFLILAAVATTNRRLIALSVLALVVCEPMMVLPAMLAAIVFAWRTQLGIVVKFVLLALAVAGVALSHPAPLAPMLRALEYSRLDALSTIVADPFASVTHTLRTAVSFGVFLLGSLGVRAFVLTRIFNAASSRDDTTERRLACTIVALGLCGVLDVGPDKAWSLSLLLAWLPVAVALGNETRAMSQARKLVALAVCAAVVFPASVNYMMHYHHSDVERVPVADVELAGALRLRSRATDPVLHRPNRQTLSAATHLSGRPAVLCYYGRTGNYDEEELDTRAADVRRFFETDDAVIARAVVDKYQVRWLFVDKRRPLNVAAPPWLSRIADGETWILYEVN